MAKVPKDSMWRYLAAFEDDHAVVEAVGECRGHGFEVLDVYGPYPIHGIEEAMGWKRSKLTWACFFFGLTGLIFALWLQYWTSATDWPLNVGGKPFDSLLAFVPVAFELTVLLAGLGTVATFLVRARLYPCKKATLTDAFVTDDRFVIAVRADKLGFDQKQLDHIWEKFGATRSWAELMEA